MAMTQQDRPLIHIDRDDCLKLEKCLTREWLETNGRGAYASSTVLFCPTRRYHALLATPLPGNVKRHVLLSRFEETLHGGGREFPFSMARYGGLWSPLGHQSIEHFDLVPYPSSLYRFGNAEVRREVLLVQDKAVVLSRYVFSGLHEPIELRLRPLLPYREADELTVENMALNPRVVRVSGGFAARPYPGMPELHVQVHGGESRFEADPVWYRGIEYSVDLARGYGGHEDQFSPGMFCVTVENGSEVIVSASAEGPLGGASALWNRESGRRRKLAESITKSEAAPQIDVRGTLSLTAEDFLYHDEYGRLGVVAGWPWFQEWGRDAFIALPGLTLARGEVERCAEALTGALGFLDRGLLPNIFGSGRADSHYGSVDASLWFARCVRLWQLAGGDQRLLHERFLPALSEIATCYRDGTGLGVAADPSGLLAAGSEDLNSTWMDAQTGDGPVTPRNGFAVEINALWYFLLAYLTELCGEVGDTRVKAMWSELQAKAGESFLERFWLPDVRYLADVWLDGVADRSVRPNMVIAAALEFSPLSRGKRTDIVDQAEAELLTPRGLRTLAPKNPAYQGRYRGSQDERDRAYHQGTVWPWLFGFYCEAYLRAHGGGAKRVACLRSLLDGYGDHLGTYGLGHVSEVFDGDPPHRPGGTIAQAWSSSELLRAYSMLDSARLGGFPA